MSSTPRRAVVVGATNGIGKAISCRLASEGFHVIAVGRFKAGRAEEVVAELMKCSSDHDKSPQPKHEFRPCDAFHLKQVKECAESIVRDYSSTGIDALVMTQGMATIQGFTPTSEGNDEKLTLHYWSRAAFANCLLPALRTSTSSNMPGGAVVMSVLSGNVHSPFARYKEDPELKQNYSIKNAADFAGFYNDLFFDKLAQRQEQQKINFIHSSPGFVASKWGTEMPTYLRAPIRIMQKMVGKSPEKCADFMVKPILQCTSGQIDLKRPNNGESGMFIMREDATAGVFTKLHTDDAKDSVWRITKEVLKKADIMLDD